MVTYTLPSSDLIVIPDAGGMRREVARIRRDERRLGNEQRPGIRRALPVVGDSEVGVHMLVVRPDPRERREDDTVSECDVADLHRLEEC